MLLGRPRHRLLAKVSALPSARLFAFADQGLQGASNILVALILARFMSLSQFASTGLAVGLFYFFFSFHRSSVVLPFILDHGKGGGEEAKVAAWWTFSVCFGLAGTLLAGLAFAGMEAASATWPAPGWVVDAVVYLTAMILPMTASEFGRRAAYQAGRPDHAVVISFAYLVAGSGGALLAAWIGSPMLGGCAYALAGVAGSAIYLIRDRPALVRLGEAVRNWQPYLGFSLWQSSASFFSALYTTSAVVLVATFAGATAAALYTAARTLVNPAISIVSAIDSLDKPRAARALAQGGIPALQASIARTRWLVVALTGGYLGLMILFAPWLLSMFFGDTYAANVTEMRVLALAFFLMCLNQPSETLLVVLQGARYLFVVRCGTAAVAILAIWLTARNHGVAGTVAAIAFVQLTALTALVAAEHLAVRGWLRAAPRALSSGEAAVRDDGTGVQAMKIAFIGCGYVFDIYMRTKWAHPELEICGFFDIDPGRAAAIERHYGLRRYASHAELLADPNVEVVVNLTNVGAHHQVSRQALEAGKHVYSEKPLSRDLDEARELFAIADAKGRIFTGAPCNLYSDAIGTIWKALRDGAIGKPALVYAELDDNPAHLMQLEHVRSPTGAPFPYAEELQEGCTVEHIGYHLAWICAMFGPAVSVSGFSKALVAKRTPVPLVPDDTPDFSVGCLTFASGAAARITCSWVAPRDHRLRIIGDEGEIAADNVFHDQSSVRLERFSRVSLTARKAFSLRRHAVAGGLFGIGGRRLKLMRRWKSHAVQAEKGVGSSLKHRLISELRRREIYAQDKFLGIAEMARAIREDRPQPMPPDFQIHITELTLMIHRAGPEGVCARPSTSFVPLEPPADVASSPVDYRKQYRPRTLERAFARLIAALHK